MNNHLLRLICPRAWFLGGITGQIVPSIHRVRRTLVFVDGGDYRLVGAWTRRPFEILMEAPNLAPAGHGVGGSRGSGSAPHVGRYIVGVGSRRAHTVVGEVLGAHSKGVAVLVVISIVSLRRIVPRCGGTEGFGHARSTVETVRWSPIPATSRHTGRNHVGRTWTMVTSISNNSPSKGEGRRLGFADIMAIVP